MKHDVLLAEIIQGYSLFDNGLVFKHPSVSERLNLPNLEKGSYEKGRELGFITKEENVKLSISIGRWSIEKDQEIKDLEWSVSAFKRQLGKLQDPSLKLEIEDKIKRDKQSLDALLLERKTCEGVSLEDYVSSKMPITLCQLEVFEDLSFSKPIDRELARKITSQYLKKNSELLDRDQLLKAVFISSFFDLFFIYDSLYNIFSKSIYELTVFQRELLGYGRVLHSKLTKMADIPDSVKNDPVKLYLHKEKGLEKTEVVETKVRDLVESAGGLDNIKAEDKLT